MINRRSVLQMLSAGLCAPLLSSAKRADGNLHPKLGLNLSGMSYWLTEQPFSNLAYNASRWRTQVRDAPFTWDDPLPPMTEDGYPTIIPDGAFMDSFLIFTSKRGHLPVNLYVNYEGQGRIAYVGGAEILERRPGCDVVRNLRRDDAFTARIVRTDSDNPIRNIRVFEQEAPPTSTFRPDFLARLQNMSVLRFMDWMGTNNSTVTKWADRPLENRFGQSILGVPIETMIELCNTAGISPWFNIPHLADDDYVRAFAEHVRRDLDPSLHIHVEYSNEVWNTIFGQADYAGKQGLELGLSDDGYEAQLRFYARRSTQIIQIWEDVFSQNPSRIIGVYAAQSANPWTSEIILSTQDVARHADVLAIAPYFGGSLGSPEQAPQVQDWSLDRLFNVLAQEVERESREQISAHAALARRYGLRLFAYEGGQHLVGHAGAENNDKLTELFIAANRDERMGKLYERHLQVWAEAGGDLYALFASMGEPSKWGSWGLLEFEGDQRPKWAAIQRTLHV